MSNILFMQNVFESFETESGVVCSPIPCIIDDVEGFFVPDGWQSELDAKGINYEVLPESKLSTPAHP